MSRWPAKLIAIDFDHTINNNNDMAPDSRYSKPFEGAKEAILAFKEKGYNIMIHSCNRAKWIEEWMNHWEIPYDYIWDGAKPVADCYIDDHAVGFRGDWKQTSKDVEEHLEKWYGKS